MAWLKKTDFNTKVTEIEGKILDVSSLVKKTDYNTKISEIENKVNDHNHDKYITTPEFNTLAARVFNSRLAKANLLTKTNFDAKLKSLKIEKLTQIKQSICLLKLN